VADGLAQGIVGSGVILPHGQERQGGQGRHTALLGEGVAAAVDVQDLQPEGDGGRVLGGGDQLQQRFLHVGGAGAAGLDDAVVEGLGAGQVVGGKTSQRVPGAGSDVHQVGPLGRVVQVGFQAVEGIAQFVLVVGDEAGVQVALAAQEPKP
jgi:hypothetical protein